MSGFINVGTFLGSLITSLLLFVLWIRVALRFVKISAIHPVSLVLNQLTQTIIQPTEWICKQLGLQSRQIDIPSLLLIVLVELVKITLISASLPPGVLPWSMVILLTLADLVIQPCNILFAALLLRVVMSWINPHWRHLLLDLAYVITDPLLIPIRRHIPPLAGLDFSPLVALVILKIITLFIGSYLPIGFIS